MKEFQLDGTLDIGGVPPRPDNLALRFKRGASTSARGNVSELGRKPLSLLGMLEA